MAEEEKKKIVLDFIRQHSLGVIATTSGNDPEAAVLAFSENSELEIIFGTLSSYRKYRNLQENPKVAFVLGWDEEKAISVQYEGIAAEMPPHELEECIAIHTKKNPASAKYAHRPEQKFFKVKPIWIRYVCLKDPGASFEILF